MIIIILYIVWRLSNLLKNNPFRKSFRNENFIVGSSRKRIWRSFFNAPVVAITININLVMKIQFSK